MTKPQELRTLPAKDLKEKVLTLQKELFTMRSKSPSEKLEKPGRIREARKEIARILTILREKEIQK